MAEATVSTLKMIKVWLALAVCSGVVKGGTRRHGVEGTLGELTHKVKAKGREERKGKAEGE